MDQTTHEIRLANWKAIVEQCQARPKGQTAKQWLVENDIPEKRYYYWLRRVRTAVVKQASVPVLSNEAGKLPAVSFAEIPVKEMQLQSEETPAVVIRTKKSTIEISNAVSEELMVKLLKVMSHAI